MKRLMLVLSFVLYGCGGGSGAQQASAPGEPRLIFIGERIGAGVDVTTSYVDLIEAETSLKVLNRSYYESGIPSVFDFCMNDRHWSDLTANDTVIMLVGYDHIRWYGIAGYTNIFDGFYEPFLNKVNESGARLHVFSPMRVHASIQTSFNPLDRATDNFMLEMRDFLKNNVEAYNSSRMTFHDLHAVFIPDASNMTPDLQYPNEYGHELIADFMLQETGL